MDILYSVQRIRKHSEDLYGPVHYSDDALFTLCGMEIESDGTWYILSTFAEVPATCRKCQKALEEME